MGKRKNRGQNKKKGAGDGSGTPSKRTGAPWMKHVAGVGDINPSIIAEVYCSAKGICKRDKKHTRNCATNPNCVLGFGEASPRKDVSGRSPADELLSEDQRYVGLKNLGATCYMNSVLQCLYHNISFRNGVMMWRDPEDAEELMGSVGFHLQMVFTHLRDGNRCSYTPNEFVTRLKIKPSVQQDPHEFFNLLLGYLEDKFKLCAATQGLIPQTFSGMCSMNTECLECRSISSSPSPFTDLELEVLGCETLTESLEQLVSREKMIGENRYHCDVCSTLCDAERYTKLTRLPEVLPLLLKRFVYDVKSEVRKKVLTVQRVPFVLDMAPHLDADEPVMYELTGVIIHIGASAHGGHYVAHVRGRDGFWWRCNDASVSPLDFNEVGYEEDVALSKKGKAKMKDKVEGTFTSPNAYLLFYTAASTLLTSTEDTSPCEAIIAAVEEENSRLRDSVNAFDTAAALSMDAASHRIARYDDVFSSIHPHDENDERWISTRWLEKFVKLHMQAADVELGPIDNTEIVCPHGHALYIPNDSVKQMKRISQNAWDKLNAMYGGGPEVRGGCRECLFGHCQGQTAEVEWSRSMAEVHRRLALPYTEGAWISKAWLQALRNSPDASALPNDLLLNIVCQHGELTLDKKKRRIVSLELWSLFENLVGYEGPQLLSDRDKCATCLAAHTEAKAVQAARREDRMEEKQLLRNAYAEGERVKAPSRRFDIPGADGRGVVCIPRPWLQEWAKYLVQVQMDDPSPIDTSSLVCRHGLMLYDPMLLPDEGWDALALVTVEEWSNLHKRHGGGPPVVFAENKDGIAPTECMEVCAECAEERAALAREAMLTYTDADIKLSYKAWEATVTHSTRATRAKNRAARRDNQYDVLSKEKGGNWVSRSRTIKASSAMTIDTLKLLIFQALEWMPSEQKLLHEDRELTEDMNELTLAQCGIARESIIQVEKAEDLDLSYEEKMQLLSISKQHADGGFAGTFLQSEGAVAMESTAAPPADSVKSVWSCFGCTFDNPDLDATECFVCATPR